MRSPEELKQLVQQAKNGDSTAFSNLYDHYLTPIFSFVYFRVRTLEDTQDLCQYVFLRAWKALPKFEQEESSFSAWLYRIARNATIDYWRKKKPLSLDPFSPVLHNRKDGSLDPLSIADRKEEAEEIREALHLLSEDQQTVLTLKFIEDFSNQEIAQITRKTEGAVRQIQSRALKVLRQHLQ